MDLASCPERAMNGDAMTNTTHQQQRDAGKAIETIAKQVLGLDTLETRNSDSLDFSEQAVWILRVALEAAYNAGLAAAVKSRQTK
jgi:hypothetical protein